jgi:hypothetical protein
MLHILPALAHRVIIPPAVADELRVGRESDVNLPDPTVFDWLAMRRPASAPATRLVTDLGASETELLSLRFRLAPHTRAAVLQLAGEEP